MSFLPHRLPFCGDGYVDDWSLGSAGADNPARQVCSGFVTKTNPLWRLARCQGKWHQHEGEKEWLRTTARTAAVLDTWRSLWT